MGAFSAQNSTQLHGGIGFTWEADVQIYHKRQMHSQFLLEMALGIASNSQRYFNHNQ